MRNTTGRSIVAATMSTIVLIGCSGDPRTVSSGAHPTHPNGESASDATATDGIANARADVAPPARGTRAYDQSVWHSLLNDHTKIRRTVRHLPNGVAATTESDHPEVAARIIDHAKAMQARMASGAQVRMWDPVFADLFARHDAVRLDVTTTAKGVQIIETSDDPETVALLRSHAMGVSEFVRAGFDAAPKETPRLTVNDPIPANEVAIGGVPHRFLLDQPTPEQLAVAKEHGISTVINFRPAGEQSFDESAAAAQAGLTYCVVPYAGAIELTDNLLDQARAALAATDANKGVAMLHCRTGNRVGPAWAAYRVINQNVPAETAIAEARAVGMVDPLLESMLRDYLRRRLDSAGAWSPVAPDALTQSQVDQRTKAIAAKDAMASRLTAALADALAAPEGPIGAIGVCRLEAPKIASAVSREQGVMLGRTSERRRNPSNGVPTWAVATIDSNTPRPAFLAHNDGSLGVAIPILLVDNCLMCHGDPAAMDPALKAAIANTYPKDRATGFASGDLRGWFWIEVPPTR